MDLHETIAGKITRRTPTHVFLLWFAFIGSLLFNVIYFSFGAISPHYDMMRQSISNLELLHQGWIQSINFVVFGASVCAFAIALRMEMQDGPIAALLALLHWLTGLGLILAGIFIHDPVHTIALTAAFVSVLISFALFAICLRGKSRWKGWAIYTVISIILMICFAARFIYCESDGLPYAGIFERLAVATRLLWVLLFIFKLLDGRRLKLAATLSR